MVAGQEIVLEINCFIARSNKNKVWDNISSKVSLLIHRKIGLHELSRRFCIMYTYAFSLTSLPCNNPYCLMKEQHVNRGA